MYYIVVGNRIVDDSWSEPKQEELQEWADSQGEHVYVIRGEHHGMTADPAEDAGEPPTMEDYLNYLDSLRESGATNMFGARPYLMLAFDNLSEDEAGKVLSHWMETFGDRHPETKRRKIGE